METITTIADLEKALRRIVEELYEDSEDHYKENGCPKGHIHETLQSVANFLGTPDDTSGSL